jgi:cyclic pyranopterin phosphate synthase
MTLTDTWGHQISYLRISITDRCNLRCVYCMPPEGIPLRPHAEMMRYEEIALVTRLAAEHGIRRVRLTGGEPLVRPELPKLVRMLSAIPEIEEISLTTNGILLEKMATALVDAGLHRVNVSLDTLQPEKFARITRGGSLERVWRGLEAAERAGLAPVKINAVAMRGFNDDELVDLARITLERAWHVRFIELMRIHNDQVWEAGFLPTAKPYISTGEIRQLLAPLGLAPSSAPSGNGPAREYTLAGAKGRIGLISPLSEHFCQECNRLRITADGCFRSCLLRDQEIPFLSALRAAEPLLPYLKQAVASKPAGHQLEVNQSTTGRFMGQIGG